MKTFLILCIFFISTSCLSKQEIKEILKSILDGNYLKKDSEDFKIILKCLDHDYFGKRFRNVRGILGSGTNAITILMDFQLLTNHPETVPVAVKINFKNLDSDENEMIGNYLNLMVNSGDQLRDYGLKNVLIFNLSRHFRKMLDGDDTFKNDVPFIDMIYEAAIISVEKKIRFKKIYQKVFITVMQPGFSTLDANFLPDPEGSIEILNQNSQNVVKMFVQISYGLWRMHDNGFYHGDLFDENIVVSGNPENFSPLIIDFDSMRSQEDLIEGGFMFQKKTLNLSDPENQNFLKYAEDPNYLIGDQNTGIYLYTLDILDPNIFTPEFLQASTEFKSKCLFNLQYSMDTKKIIRLFIDLLKKYAANGVITLDNENIKKSQELLNSIKKSWDEQTKFLTSYELFETLNNANDLGLNSFHFFNPELENYFGIIRNKKKTVLVERKMKLADSPKHNNVLLV
jgi:serine/threonine protein kinase